MDRVNNNSTVGGKKRRSVKPLPAGFKTRYGSRVQVWNKSAWMTTSGLKRSDLMMNKRGRIVSKKKHELGKKNKLFKKLTQALVKKGKFHLITKAEAKKALSKK